MPSAHLDRSRPCWFHTDAPRIPRGTHTCRTPPCWCTSLHSCRGRPGHTRWCPCRTVFLSKIKSVLLHSLTSHWIRILKTNFHFFSNPEHSWVKSRKLLAIMKRLCLKEMHNPIPPTALQQPRNGINLPAVQAAAEREALSQLKESKSDTHIK